MAENKEVENEEKIEEKELNRVAGGGLFSEFSVKEYNEAGVGVIGAGTVYNEGYILAASGETLSADQAEDAVRFWQVNHYQTSNKAELE